MTTIRSIKVAILLTVLSLSPLDILAADDSSTPTEGIDEQWLKTLVSIEVVPGVGDPQAIGSGFLIATTNKHNILVTAKHVVVDDKGQPITNLAYRFNQKSGNAVLVTEDHMARYAQTWFYSTDADVACRFIVFSDNFDIKALTEDLFLSWPQLKPGANVLIPGFPLGIRSPEHADPIVRRGIVARASSNDIVLDAFVFPGNSGGPVIYVPTLKFSGDIIKIPFINRERFIGLVSGSISYVDTAISQQTRRPRVTFEENSGLCNIVSAQSIAALLNREDVKKHDSIPDLKIQPSE